MKTKLNGILTLALVFAVQLLFAQEKTISGTVSDGDGIPLPGATVIVQGTTNGVSTDFDGNYTIFANEGETLSFSFIGYVAKTVVVGASNTINVTLETDSQQLDEVIVTSLGIKREKKALGYAVSEVDQTQLEQRADGDIGRVLSGKASGVNITNQSGLSGSGTSIVIRGFNSFSQGNQPLFIVDGIPFSTETNNQGSFVDGNNGSSRFLDIDPNNIENVSVLKGLAASTLYGTQGRNGVILITTKAGQSGTGAKKTEITVNTSMFINEMASMPEYQNDYGGGFDQSFGWFFSNWGPAFRQEGVDGWGNQNAINGTTSGTPGFLRHPYTTASASTGIPAVLDALGIAPDALQEWKPYRSVENFFRKGEVRNTNLNVRGASADGTVSYNINYGNLADEGFTPGNKLSRNTLSFGGNAKLSNKFSINGTLNYTGTKFKSPPVAAGYGSNVGGDGASIFANIFYTPRSVDLMGQPYQNPVTGESIYYRQNNSIQNPLWTVANASNSQAVNRVFGGAALNYEINDNLNATYRYGIDVYNENNVNYSNKGGKTGSVATQSGVYDTWNNVKTIFDHNFAINGDYKINDDLGLTFALGATSRSDTYDRNGVSSTGQQVFGVLRHFNFELQDEIQYFEKRNIIGAYGQAALDYKSMAFLTVAARKDWVSNLSTENNSITYPSASISFLPTAAFDGLKSDMVNYLKLRAGYGTSANFPSGYPIASVLSLNTQSFQDQGGNMVISNTSGSQLGNPNLKPELIGELEFGVEGRFFNNKLSADISIYNKITKDLIISRPLDPSTGYTSTQTNIGEIENKGIEIDLGMDWFSNPNGLTWNTFVNWSTNDAIVTDLGQDTEEIVYSGFSSLGNVAKVGKSLGTIVGSAITRNENGEFLVNSQGSYDITYGTNEIGNANADWLLNISNTISYKNLSMSFLVNHVHGGDVFTYSVATLLGRGVLKETADRAQSFVLPGVQADGTPNSVMINNSTYYFSNVLYGPDEMLVYDASVWRLAEISLTYKVPQSLLNKTPFGSIDLTASGYNLWYDAYNTPDGANWDPNIAGTGVGNGRGFDYLNGPSAKKYGLSLKLTF
ncbi:MAG: SusC/RagA family TonB-linked outer membrane protein [Flavobacteriaceae bacterium]|nr:SusC/RagA family TonB-linked outer membrane protein [Flavobacteriaceae bacterium]MDG2317661.1 SusC/RagA family TonB-linked outer membrane protein [Flavobacteriaceae bacterium]